MDPRNPAVVFVCGVSVATILAVAATSELFTVPTHVRPRLSTQTAQPPLVLHQRGFAEVASSTLSPVAVPIPAQKVWLQENARVIYVFVQAVLPAFVLTVSAGISAVAALVLRTSHPILRNEFLKKLAQIFRRQGNILVFILPGVFWTHPPRGATVRMVPRGNPGVLLEGG